MADLKVLIKASALTGTLKNLADLKVSAAYLNIPSADRAAAETELATISTDDWLSSDTTDERGGFQSSDGILLPKHVIEG